MSAPGSPSAVVIGAGFGGIGAAAALVRAGFDVTVLEAADGVGGVWRDNTYPNCACDVPASLYSFSFVPQPDWSRRYPPQAEILAYLESCVDRLGLRPHLRLGTRVVEAAWDDAGRRWQVETADGATYAAEVLVPAVGQLSRPHVPHLPGAERFTGPAFHSARWRHDVRLEGRRVAVVGTGASAIQFVPYLAGRAEHITVFQRSAPWIVPKPDRRYGRATHALTRRVRGFGSARRAIAWAGTWAAGRAVTGQGPARATMRALARWQLRRQVPDPALRARLTPDFPLGCKRTLFSDDWLPTLTRPDVELVTAPIADVGPSSIRTADGGEHPCDVLVYGTGFAAVEFLMPMRVRGRGGLDLHDVWRDGAHAHLGISVPGFPNLFLIYGPNTNTGNTSVLYFEEAQARYLVQAMRVLAAAGPGAALEVCPEVEARSDAELQRRLASSVWTACTSWYRTPQGRVVTNWPGAASEYRRRTRSLRLEDYALTGLGVSARPLRSAAAPARPGPPSGSAGS